MRCKKCLFGGIICGDNDTLDEDEVMCPRYSPIDDDEEIEELICTRRAEFYEEWLELLEEIEEW